MLIGTILLRLLITPTHGTLFVRQNKSCAVPQFSGSTDIIAVPPQEAYVSYMLRRKVWLSVFVKASMFSSEVVCGLKFATPGIEMIIT